MLSLRKLSKSSNKLNSSRALSKRYRKLILFYMLYKPEGSNRSLSWLVPYNQTAVQVFLLVPSGLHISMFKLYGAGTVPRNGSSGVYLPGALISYPTRYRKTGRAFPALWHYSDFSAEASASFFFVVFFLGAADSSFSFFSRAAPSISPRLAPLSVDPNCSRASFSL